MSDSDFGIYATRSRLYDYNNRVISLSSQEIGGLLEQIWKIPPKLVRKATDTLLELFVEKPYVWDKRGKIWPVCISDFVEKTLDELDFSPTHQYAAVFAVEMEIVDRAYLKKVFVSLGMDEKLKKLLLRTKTCQECSDEVITRGLTDGKNDNTTLISSVYAGPCDWLVNRILGALRFYQNGSVIIVLQDPETNALTELAKAEAEQIKKAKKLKLEKYAKLEGFSVHPSLNLLRYYRLLAFTLTALYGLRLTIHPLPMRLLLSTKVVTMRGNLARDSSGTVTDGTYIRFPEWTQGLVNVTQKAKNQELKNNLWNEAVDSTRLQDWAKVATLLDHIREKELRIMDEILELVPQSISLLKGEGEVHHAVKMTNDVLGRKDRAINWYKEDFFPRLLLKQNQIVSEISELARIADDNV